MRVLKRRGVDPGSDEAGDVGHVDEEVSADRIGDLAHPGEVDDLRVGRGPCGDHFGLIFLRDHGKLVVINRLALFGDTVVFHFVKFAGEIGKVPVGEVTAVGEVHRENLVAGLEDAEVDGGIGLRSAVRLHVGEFSPE